MTTRYEREAIEAKLDETPNRWVQIDSGPTNMMQAYASRWRGSRSRATDGRGPYTYKATSAGRGTGIANLWGKRIRE